MGESHGRPAVIIGLDIGTTSAKAAAYDTNGIEVASTDVPYELHTSPAGGAEQDPDEVIAGALRALDKTHTDARERGASIVGIACSTAMHSLIGLDARGQPLTPVLTWADTRAAATADALRDQEGGRVLYRRTGTPLHPMSPMIKLRWLGEHDPDLCARVAHWVSLKEYLLQQLTGQAVVDHSIASASGLWNIQTRDWDDQALAFAGIRRAQLSPLVTTREVLRALPGGPLARIGLNGGTPIVVGASDGALANLGVGAIQPGVAAVTIGTSGAVRVVEPEPRIDEAARTFCYALTENHWIVGGATSNGGLVLRWLHDLLSGGGSEPSHEAYDRLIDEAAAVPPGAAGVVFLPLLSGERSPHWRAEASGGLAGLRVEHGRPHIVRAALEAVALQLRTVLDATRDAGATVTRLRGSGGFTRSALWRQVVADVLGIDLEVMQESEASAFGAALLGLDALGYIESFEVAPDLVEVREVHTTDPGRAAYYNAVLAIYETLYDQLEPLFATLRELSTSAPNSSADGGSGTTPDIE